MFNKYLTLAAVVVCTANAVNGYTYEVIDCMKPSRVNEYQLNSICPKVEVQQSMVEEEMMLLQVESEQVTKGYRCSVTSSTFWLYCGAFSHTKLAKVPSIGDTEDISPEKCEYMSRNQIYTAPDGTSRKLELNKVNRIEVIPIGSLTADANVGCKGESLHINGKIVYNILKMQTFKVIIQEQSYLVKESTIELRSNHAVLPCTASSTKCTTATGTYIWVPTQDCKLGKIRSITGQRRGSWFIDHHKSLIINITGNARQCEDYALKSTNYQGVYIAKPGKYPNLPPVDVKMEYEIRSKIDFENFINEQRVEAMKGDLYKQICNKVNLIQLRDAELIPLGPELEYGMISGEVVYRIRCEKKTLKIVEKEVCFNKVPVMTSQGEKWTDPVTKILGLHSTHRPCNKRFPLIIKAVENWISINPHISPVATPDIYEIKLGKFHHEEAGTGGIYTEQEMEAWNQLVVFPEFRRELQNEIATGVCQSSLDNCQVMENGRRYDLDKLSPSGLGTWNPFDWFKQKIKEYGMYLSGIVILGWFLQLIVYVVTVVHAYATMGWVGTIAVSRTLFCHATTTRKRIQAKAERRQRQMIEEELPLAPRWTFGTGDHQEQEV